MTDFTSLLKPDRGEPATAIHLLTKDGLETWLTDQPPRIRAAAAAARFKGAPGDLAILPGDAEEWFVAFGVPATIGPWDLAPLPAALPAGTYRLSGEIGGGGLGWLLAQHRFDKYRSTPKDCTPRTLLTSKASDIDGWVAIAEAVALVRDLVDTPTVDMGPAELAAAIVETGEAYGARIAVIEGDALAAGFPMIHAVGRAAAPDRQPRLIRLDWGDPAAPHVVLVGKGVCFDTGGLDIKPASAMRLMKKDMGGAAHALALAQLVMRTHLPVRLTLLVPAVENAVAGDAFRPGDVLASRKGLTVEIGNTDAEGRLILGDALALASEEAPALILDFATLTGAARVALGPDLPALFANDDDLARALLSAGEESGDPLWRLPLHAGYEELLKSDIADLNNAPEGGMAGAVTAALFLQRFVRPETLWAHFDTFAWRHSPRPGRPRGGEALGLRAAWSYLLLEYGRT
ncbi:leucyl aminopeptidase family protein [Sphingomonas sp. ID0503]|uniref:leucyl aminopeptidase family protein n=1 Tax=Sphingomonas sp. ID0503 TaxID=3399691 RepID=UPI003AFAD3DD